MIMYSGPSEEFHNVIVAFQGRLEEIYRTILRDRYVQVERFMTEGMFINPSRRRSVLTESVDGHVSLPARAYPQHYSVCMGLVGIDEDMTHDLDRRVLQALGYDPSNWNREGWDPLSNDPFDQVISRRRAHFARLDEREYCAEIKDWHLKVVKSQEAVTNLCRSLLGVRLRKSPSEEYGGHAVDEIVGVGADGDCFSGVAIMSPKLDRVRMGENGKLILLGKQEVVTSPFVALADEGVDISFRAVAERSGIPPHLLAYIHEFDHIVGYGLQKAPLALMASLFYGKATGQLKE